MTISKKNINFIEFFFLIIFYLREYFKFIKKQQNKKKNSLVTWLVDQKKNFFFDIFINNFYKNASNKQILCTYDYSSNI